MTDAAVEREIHRVRKKKVDHFYFFAIISAKVDQFSNIFTVKFRNDLRRKIELKLPPPLKSVATLPCEK